MDLFYFDLELLGKKYNVEIEYKNHHGVIEFYYVNVITPDYENVYSKKVDLLPLLDLQQQYELQEKIIQWDHYMESIRIRKAA
jgi:hypothetical protein